ncbi:hypothetical protein [Crossiella sp. CA198]|uniref:hypothetical protein n=1 Tax=Crossiella sp. CA198 TaxID=3455607 RepID=UPI003F8D1719
MTQKSMAVVASLVLTLVGVALGLWPASIVVASETVSCGSPWSPDDTPARTADFGRTLGHALRGERATAGTGVQRCSEALGSRGLFGGIILGVGVVALIGALAMRPKEQAISAAPSLADQDVQGTGSAGG